MNLVTRGKVCFLCQASDIRFALFLGYRIYLFSCPIGDGWLPFLGPRVTSFYRKRRRILIDLRLTSFKGLDMIFMFFFWLVPERSLFCFFSSLVY